MILKDFTCAFFKYNRCRTISNINFTKYSTYKKMAKSKFEYVRYFENEDKLLRNCWIVVRLDGKGFHKFTTKHNFDKPNDFRGLNLMNKAAIRVMQEFKDISIAFGESDEYSFVFRKDTDIFNRRGSKIMSYVNSLFSTSYVFYWREYFDFNMLYPPMFDARIVLYPTDDNLRDYLSWRQADVHVNNLYNTTFWALVLKGGLTNVEAEKRLCGSVSSQKHEILFSEFGINYNNEPLMFKKGTILLKKRLIHKSVKPVQVTIPFHVDLINDSFWEEHKEILGISNPSIHIWPENEEIPIIISKQIKPHQCLQNDENAEVIEKNVI